MYIPTHAICRRLIYHPSHVIHTTTGEGKAVRKSFKETSENKCKENVLLIISAILNISGDIEQNPGPGSSR